MLKLIGACVVAASVSGCTWVGSQDEATSTLAGYTQITFAGETATGEERSRCEAAGGEIHPDGLAGWERCIQTYSDAGKSCTDTADCLGRCQVEGEFVDMGEGEVTGQCQATDSPFGCFQSIENGVTTSALCVD